MALNAPISAATATAERANGNTRFAFFLVTSLFFMWGLSYGLLDVLNKHFQETLQVSRAKSALLQAAYFGAYFLMAMPAAALMNRKGYKTGILLGLFLFAAGALLFIPATTAGQFEFFLFALFVIASGLACLETAANPYVTFLGPPERSEQRLNLSQSFNGLGQFVGPLIGGAVFFGGGGNNQGGVQAIYVAIAAVVVVIAVLVARTPMPYIHEETVSAHGVSVRPLRAQRHLLYAVVAQFFCVAAQVGVGAFFINYVTEHAHGISSQNASYLLSVGMLCFLGGRFLGTALMGRIAPATLLATYALINVALSLVVVAGAGLVSVIALIAIFFFMSIQFPTIFALGVKNLGVHTKRGASFIIMAIVGGAIVPYFMGLLADHYSTAVSYLIPAACFAVVAWYGRYGYQLDEH
ncbi:sugar MFS transporter [Lysobacter sp. CFH 32150]|uniref:sugar MFS transporter n=1 Tax=Lysobacter sp. CFH 32150 TaxID=2927128 RepID=UPI001FA7D31C|nr:sugar MFS transporter [Lysobacter sp. CFH 32150]MCI4569114.1 sugar MFS transporter [Lysobacter sp. CFH 32150]